MRSFDFSLDYKQLDLREHPELYAVGKGEQGVLLVEPYKGEARSAGVLSGLNATT